MTDWQALLAFLLFLEHTMMPPAWGFALTVPPLECSSLDASLSPLTYVCFSFTFLVKPSCFLISPSCA